MLKTLGRTENGESKHHSIRVSISDSIPPPSESHTWKPAHIHFIINLKTTIAYQEKIINLNTHFDGKIARLAGDRVEKGVAVLRFQGKRDRRREKMGKKNWELELRWERESGREASNMREIWMVEAMFNRII